MRGNDARILSAVKGRVREDTTAPPPTPQTASRRKATRARDDTMDFAENRCTGKRPKIGNHEHDILSPSDRSGILPVYTSPRQPPLRSLPVAASSSSPMRVGPTTTTRQTEKKHVSVGSNNPENLTKLKYSNVKKYSIDGSSTHVMQQRLARPLKIAPRHGSYVLANTSTSAHEHLHVPQFFLGPRDTETLNMGSISPQSHGVVQTFCKELCKDPEHVISLVLAVGDRDDILRERIYEMSQRIQYYAHTRKQERCKSELFRQNLAMPSLRSNQSSPYCMKSPSSLRVATMIKDPQMIHPYYPRQHIFDFRDSGSTQRLARYYQEKETQELMRRRFRARRGLSTITGDERRRLCEVEASVAAATHSMRAVRSANPTKTTTLRQPSSAPHVPAMFTRRTCVTDTVLNRKSGGAGECSRGVSLPRLVSDVVWTEHMSKMADSTRRQRGKSDPTPAREVSCTTFPRKVRDRHNVALQFSDGGPVYPIWHFSYDSTQKNGCNVNPERVTGGGIVHWLGKHFGTEKWRNPAISQHPSVEPLVSVSRSSDAKGSASDSVSIAECTSCTKSSPVVCKDSEGNEMKTNWYLFDFKTTRIQPTHYSIGHAWKKGKYCILSWKLEGSVDDSDDPNSWVVLSDHNNDWSLLKSATNMYSWPLHNKNAHWFRYFKLSMTGPNAHGSYTMCVFGFDLYGECVETRTRPKPIHLSVSL